MLLHPVALAALITWAFNDHVLKGWARGPLTGKLSDVASLVFFPVLATSIIEVCVSRASTQMRRHMIALNALCTAAVMATINTLDKAAAAYQWGLGTAQWPLHAASAFMRGLTVPAIQPVSLTMDPTDLWTLPATFIALWIARSPQQPTGPLR